MAGAAAAAVAANPVLRDEARRLSRLARPLGERQLDQLLLIEGETLNRQRGVGDGHRFDLRQAHSEPQTCAGSLDRHVQPDGLLGIE